MSLVIFTHPDCLLHDLGPAHPERPDRLGVVLKALQHPNFASLEQRAAPLAARDDLLRVHPASYIDRICSLAPHSGALISIDADTAVGPGTITAALRSAGGAVAAVEAVLRRGSKRAFVATRPPGHHAEAEQAMGFCFFANAAVAALAARDHFGLSRVAVVDFDVHHGNGTAAVFEGQAGLFYGSSHQSPCYPGTGSALLDRDLRCDVPLAPGTGSEGFRAGYLEHLLPALERFAPELLVLSAGFDAHHADPLAQLRLGVEDFAWVTERLVDVAERHCGGRLVSLLEGGYDLEALAASVSAHLEVLMRDQPDLLG